MQLQNFNTHLLLVSLNVFLILLSSLQSFTWITWRSLCSLQETLSAFIHHVWIKLKTVFELNFCSDSLRCAGFFQHWSVLLSFSPSVNHQPRPHRAGLPHSKFTDLTLQLLLPYLCELLLAFLNCFWDIFHYNHWFIKDVFCFVRSQWVKRVEPVHRHNHPYTQML